MLICPKCGEEVDARETYCPHCGYPIGVDQWPADPQVVNYESL